MLEYVKDFFASMLPGPLYQLIATILFVGIIALAIFLCTKWSKGNRPNVVLGMVILALVEMLLMVGYTDRWQCIVSLLPTLLVAYQAFFLWLYHPRTSDTKHETGGEISANVSDRQKKLQDELREISYEKAIESMSSHFGLKTLFIRYGLPAVLLGIAGVVLSEVIVSPDLFFAVFPDPHGFNASKILLGIKFGAAGAYVYVLLELGRRTFRHDVTGASAMWCLVTLVLGPVLAAIVAVLWRMSEPATGDWWAGGLVLFFTGFAPRRVIAALVQAAAQLLKAGGQSGVVESRLIPMGKIRGITPEIEERLSEEGILDVNSLASAEPVRLVRNTSFDMKQILNWIDEAILIVTLPKSWEAFEEEGITGAIDLCWYYAQTFDQATGSPVKGANVPAEIIDLANKGKVSPASLVSTIQRLYEDAQVQFIWALYYNFTEYSGSDEPGDSRKAKG